MSTKNKTWLYKEISKRGLFTLNDVKDMIRILCEILEEEIYIKGEELLQQSKTLQRRWNKKLTAENIEAIKEELEALK